MSKPLFQQRRGTAADLAAANELPLDGQIYVESGTDIPDKIKIGDGVTRYNDLPYLSANPPISAVIGLTEALAGKQPAGSYAAQVHTHLAADVLNFSSSVISSLSTASRVGVGTSSPTATLQCVGGAGTTALAANGASGCTFLVDYNASGSNWHDANYHVFRTCAGPDQRLTAQLDNRFHLIANNEPYGLGARYNLTGGEVWFGATDGTSTPSAVISNAIGVALMTLAHSGAVTIPGSLSVGGSSVIVATDSRLTDARTPLAHTHPASQVTGLATVATTGNYNDLTNKPTIPSAYTLPTASATVLGGVKVGTGLSIDAGGVISATGGGTSGITQTDADARYVKLAGSTMTGSLVVDATMMVGSTAISNGLRYLDITNTGTGSGSGSIMRLVTQNVAGTGNVSVDFVKYKNGAFLLNNSETDTTAYTAILVSGTELLRLTNSSVFKTQCLGRFVSTASSEAYAIGAKYSAAGGAVYFGATDATATPGMQFSNAGGGALLTITNGGAASIPGSLTVGGNAVVVTTDSRLSDARQPLTHTHGNITNSGAIGSTSGQIVVTTTGGVLTTSASLPSSQVTGLSTVATTGSYTDLTNKPSIPSAYTLPVATASVLGGCKQGANVTIAADGTISVSAPVTSLPAASITGLATVATTGSYTDLSNQPTIMTFGRILALC